jgi:putative phosphoribosyl transferase
MSDPMKPESSHKRAAPLKQPLPFPDLRSAGRALTPCVENYRDPDAIVLGVALGGVPVAQEVASSLQAPLDLIIIRRLLAPQGPGSQICAVNVAGQTVVDEQLKPRSAPQSPLEHFIVDALAELENRAQICRRGQPPVSIADRTVIVVDCGIRTGLTIKAAIDAVRNLNPKRIIGATPVASPEGYAAIVNLFDEVVCLAQPEKFGNVGLWYRDFRRPGDEQLGALLGFEQ